MKKSMKFATALAGAAVVVVGGTAFTDTNTLQDDTRMGYDTTTVSGVVVESTDFTYDAAAHELDAVKFTTTHDSLILAADLATTTARLEVTGGTSEVVTSCGLANTGVGVAEVTEITCTLGTPKSVQSITGMNLTVTSDEL